jgi:hypothetical protein
MSVTPQHDGEVLGTRVPTNHQSLPPYLPHLLNGPGQELLLVGQKGHQQLSSGLTHLPAHRYTGQAGRHRLSQTGSTVQPLISTPL